MSHLAARQRGYPLVTSARENLARKGSFAVNRRGWRLTVGLTVVALSAAACSSSTGLTAQQRSARATGNVTLKTLCTGSLCAGTRSSAAFKIEMPKDKKAWNGTLLI